MKYPLLLVLVVGFVFACNAQSQFDTLSIVQYNLTDYNAPGISCTPLPVKQRNGYLNTIISYLLPDIFCVEEMGNSQASVDSLLNGALNKNGRDYYQSATFSPNGQDINNMIFYNSKKIRLVNQTLISCTPRQANVYNLEYVNPADETEKIPFSIVIAHLKASDGSAEATQRAACAGGIMTYFNANYTGTSNLFVVGDFNLYSTNEAAYQTFTTYSNPKVKLYDYVYALTTLDGVNKKYFYTGNNTTIGTGTWNNSQFAKYHTQCPIATPVNCYVGGGLDDRFDYILFNRSVFDDSLKMNFIPGSYRPVGNDGYHYNLAINDGANASVPTSVLNALVSNSDHLPVTASFKMRIAKKTADMIVAGQAYKGVNTITIIAGSATTYSVVGINTTISGNYTEDNGVITITGKAVASDNTVKNITLSGVYTLDNSFNISLSVNNVSLSDGGTTGVDDSSGDIEIFIQNPVEEYLPIYIKSPAGRSVNVSLLNLQGREERQWSDTPVNVANQVTLAGLASGMYFVCIESGNGLKFIKRIVKW